MSEEENDDYILSAERKAKQDYLNDEIIGVGYDPTLFMEYLSKVKEPDIDLWTFDELQEIVKSFKVKHRTTDAPKKSFAASAPPPEVVEEEISHPEASAPGFSVEEIKHDTNTVKCKPIEPNQLTECEELQIKVGKPEVTQGGIFSRSFVTYTVFTEPLGWNVKRRYSDFIWLREVLLATNLLSYMPPLPAKKMTGNLEEKNVHKREQYLNSFMIVLSKDQIMRSSPHLLKFLTETDEKVFKKHVKSTKLKKIEKISQTTHLNGEALVEYGDCSQVYDSQLKYLSAVEALKKKIKHKCSQIMEDDKKLSESIKKYAEIIKELQEAQKKIPNNDSIEKMYGYIYDSLIKWSNYENDNIISLNDDVRIPFSTTHKEVNILKELIKEKEALYSNYRKLEAKQKQEKSRENLDQAKEMFGFANYKVQREVERTLKNETSLAYQHFLMSASRQAERVKQFHIIWGELLKQLSEERAI